MASQLINVPPPGFIMVPGFTAQQPATFITKERDTWKWKQNSYDVTRPTPAGGSGQPFMQIVGESRKEASFRTMDGQVVMRIVKDTPIMGSPVYRGFSPTGKELWTMTLKSKWTGSGWTLTMHDTSLSRHSIKIESKVLSANKEILLDGQPVVTLRQQGSLSHIHREDVVSIAPGMDIILALSVNWVKIDKEHSDAVATAVG